MTEALEPEYIPLEGYSEYSEEEMLDRAQVVLDALNARRTIRDFSNKPVPRELIETCIKALTKVCLKVQLRIPKAELANFPRMLQDYFWNLGVTRPQFPPIFLERRNIGQFSLGDPQPYLQPYLCHGLDTGRCYEQHLCRG